MVGVIKTGNFIVDEVEDVVHYGDIIDISSYPKVMDVVFIDVQRKDSQINVLLLIFQVGERSKVIYNYEHIVLG